MPLLIPSRRPLLYKKETVAAPSPNTFLTSLLAYYALDDDGAWNDDSGNGYHLSTERNNPGVISAKLGDGVDISPTESIERTNSGAVFSGWTDMSLNLWFNANTLSGEQTLCCLWDIGSGQTKGWWFGTDGDELKFVVALSGDTADTFDAYETTDAANLSTSTTYMATVTYEGGTVTIYLNGDAEASTTTGTIPTTIQTCVSTSEYALGASSSNASRPWDGWIDEHAVWDERVLTAEEIKTNGTESLWNSGTGLFFDDYN